MTIDAVTHLLRKIPRGSYIQPTRADILRSSSLPFCALHRALDKDNPDDPSLTKLGLERVQFADGFYFAIGNALHHLWQNTGKYVLKNELIGDWQCTRELTTKETDKTKTRTTCNQQAKFCSFKSALKKPCPHKHKDCYNHIYYKEVELQHDHLGGHPDFIWRDKKGYYHIIDFKTTSMFLFDKPEIALKNNYYPSQKYLVQIQVYCHLLERKYKIKVKSYTIAYIARETAMQRKTKKPILKTFTYKYDSNTAKLVGQQIKIYNRDWQTYLKWREAKTKAHAKAIYEQRPCKSARDYVNNMKKAFPIEDCPHHLSGGCYNGKSLKNMYKIVEKQNA